MSKWISDAYIKRLLQKNRLLQGNCEYKLWEQEVEKIVDAMPSIDIVRCKECKHGEYREDFDDYECHSSGCGLVYDADFFCADGERKESE